jgi:hypothetical protein
MDRDCAAARDRASCLARKPRQRPFAEDPQLPPRQGGLKAEAAASASRPVAIGDRDLTRKTADRLSGKPRRDGIREVGKTRPPPSTPAGRR